MQHAVYKNSCNELRKGMETDQKEYFSKSVFSKQDKSYNFFYSKNGATNSSQVIKKLFKER